MSGALIALFTASLTGQTPEQLQLLRNDPALVRQYIGQSGLTPEQIRQRLASSGYSTSLLDQYLEPMAGAPGTLSDQQLQALRSLGVVAFTAEGLEPISVDTGFVRRYVVDESDTTELRLFGLEAFRSRTTQFQPVLSGPVPASYKVGPGDVMVLVITGDVEFVHQLTVTREGFIVIPQVGQIFVANVTMAHLNSVLRQRLGQSYSGVRTGTTRFDVTISRLRTNQVYVTGEVVQAGAYQLASVATGLNALYAAGGPTWRGNFRRVHVLRAGDTVTTLDLYEYLLTGTTTRDVILEQGDVVFVPLRGSRVKLTGAVVRPAIYETNAGETLRDVVAMAGGLRADARTERLAVHRILPAGERGPGPFPRAVVDVPLGVGSGTGVTVPPLRLEDGDSVVADEIPGLADLVHVTMAGMVHKPGRYEWRPGLTLRDLVLLARGPRIGADLREAEVSRLPTDRASGELSRTLRVPLDSTYLLERDSAGDYHGAVGLPFPGAGSAPETELRPFDQVTIFRQPEFELQRLVKIFGEVMVPGTYALTRKDERLSELVRRAGGLTATAYPGGARFFRQFENAGQVNIDLSVAVAEPGEGDDVILQPGDSLFVPEYIATVRVQGAVVNPTSALYRPGAGIDFYVANAGGYARNADQGRASVRYANGEARVRDRFLFFGTSPQPGPGSVINVPAKPASEPLNVTQLLGTIAQIMASTVAIVVLATR